MNANDILVPFQCQISFISLHSGCHCTNSVAPCHHWSHCGCCQGKIHNSRMMWDRFCDLKWLQKSQWFMLPWLVIFGVAVPCGIVGSILCLTRIPSRNPLDNDFYNFIHGLVSLTILLVTVFIIYPTWHLSLHVFSYPCSQELYSINNRRDYLFKYFYS